MGIKEITTSVTGLSGVLPVTIYIDTDDTVAEVTAVGYLNHIVEQQGHIFSPKQMALVYTTDGGCDWYQITIAGANTSLVLNVSPGDVLLPVTAGHIATFTNVMGQIGDTVTPAIHLGTIQTGDNGLAGAFVAYPAGANTGFFRITATNNGGAFNTLITNAALGQTTTFTIPNPGIAATNFLLTNNATTQVIATGSLSLTLGNITAAAGNIAATLGSVAAGTTVTAGTGITSVTGNVTAGSAGNAGTFIAFPATAANGTLIVSATNAGGAFDTTITNRARAQSTVMSFADVVSATGSFLVAATVTPFTANHTIVASGTGGLMVDSGYQMKTVAGAAVAGGAAAQVIVDAFVTAASNIVASWNTQTNAASILTVTPGVGSFTVTSSADPGASTINYIVTKV